MWLGTGQNVSAIVDDDVSLLDFVGVRSRQFCEVENEDEKRKGPRDHSSDSP